MPAFLEAKLRQEYGANSATPFKIMNAMGAMRGNKETAKGAAMEAKHNAKLRRMEIEPAENGGATITHHMKEMRTGDSREPMSYTPPTTHVFGASEGAKMMDHIATHLGMGKPGMSKEDAGAIREKAGK